MGTQAPETFFARIIDGSLSAAISFYVLHELAVPLQIVPYKKPEDYP